MNDFTLGQHTAQISDLQSDMKEVKQDVKQILSLVSEVKGGWKTLALIGAATGGVTGFLVALVLQ